MTAETDSVERWTYLGRRSGSAGPVQAFETSDGRLCHYSRLAPSWARPGQRFDITVSGDSVYTKGAKAPRYVDRPDDERIAEWAVLDAAAENAAEASKKGKLAASLSAFDQMTIVELRGLYVTQRTRAARAALVAKLIESVVG